MGSTDSYTTSSSLHIMMYPFLAFGHISPFLNLARKITTVDPSARITILSAPANVPRIASLLTPSPSPSSIRIHPLPLPAVPGLPEGIESTADLSPADSELLKLAVDATRPQLQSLLSETKPDFVLFDFAQPWLPSVASPLGVKSLFFSVFAAISTAYLTVPSRGPAPSVADLKNPPPSFPPASSIALGVPTYQARDFAYVFRKFDGGPTVYDRVVRCMRGCTAILAKTCVEIEGQYIAYVESQYEKPVLLAGPVVPEPPSSGELEPEWAGWLGAFEEGSVVFCSFGSETFLGKDDVRELVLGLEMTGLPFVAVLNPPQRSLPEGFEERVKGRGAVRSGWVPQQAILRHAAVGCFVNHAGFSSVVEGIAAGRRLVFLPQRGDQYVNSALFAGDLGIGVEVSREEGDGGFGRDAVCDAVRKAVAGEKQGKLREFLMDKRVEERFIVELVERLRELASDRVRYTAKWCVKVHPVMTRGSAS